MYQVSLFCANEDAKLLLTAPRAPNSWKDLKQVRAVTVVATGATNHQMSIEVICLLGQINQLLGFFFAFLWQKAGKENSRLSVSMSVVHFHPHIFFK